MQAAHERRLREKLLAEELPIRIVAETTCEFVCVVEEVDSLQINTSLRRINFSLSTEIVPSVVDALFSSFDKKLGFKTTARFF